MVGIAYFPPFPPILSMHCASTVKCVRLQPCSPHGLDCGNLPLLASEQQLVRSCPAGKGLRPMYFPALLAMATFALTLKDILALKLCDRCEHSEHKLASGRSCVDGLPLRLTNSTCFSVRRSIRSSRSRVLRAKRLMDSTITVSPCRT